MKTVILRIRLHGAKIAIWWEPRRGMRIATTATTSVNRKIAWIVISSFTASDATNAFTAEIVTDFATPIHVTTVMNHSFSATASTVRTASDVQILHIRNTAFLINNILRMSIKSS